MAAVGMIDGPVLLAVPVPVPEPELVVFAVLLPVAVGAGAAVGNHQCGHRAAKEGNVLPGARTSKLGERANTWVLFVELTNSTAKPVPTRSVTFVTVKL